MKIEVITIGNEILTGEIVNTNAVFISRELAFIGLNVDRHLSLPDDPLILERGIQEAIKRADVVVLTGGLGPTCDDHTKKVLCEVFKKKLTHSRFVEETLLKRYGKELLSLKEQATVPEDVTILNNHVGTAPGFLFEKEGKWVVALPGVSVEMKEMFLKEVIPRVEKTFCPQSYLKKEYGVSLLTENEIDPFLRRLIEKESALEVGIYPGMGLLRVKLGMREKKEGAKNKFQSCCSLFEKEFEKWIFSKEGKTLSMAIQELFVQKKLCLACAESCTGGQISAYITSTPGASKYFLGSIVAYSNQMKSSLLNVESKVIEASGAVSEEVVKQMLEGIFKATTADVAIAVSGIAGPEGGTKEKPVGTVWCGIAFRAGRTYVWKILAKGGAKRELVIDYTTHFILGSLYRSVAHQVNPLTK